MVVLYHKELFISMLSEQKLYAFLPIFSKEKSILIRRFSYQNALIYLTYFD